MLSHTQICTPVSPHIRHMRTRKCPSQMATVAQTLRRYKSLLTEAQKILAEEQSAYQALVAGGISVYAYRYAHVYAYGGAYTRTYMHGYMRKYKRSVVHIRVHICVSIRAWPRICTHICTRICTRTCTSMYVYTPHTHTHTHTMAGKGAGPQKQKDAEARVIAQIDRVSLLSGAT